MNHSIRLLIFMALFHLVLSSSSRLPFDASFQIPETGGGNKSSSFKDVNSPECSKTSYLVTRDLDWLASEFLLSETQFNYQSFDCFQTVYYTKLVRIETTIRTSSCPDKGSLYSSFAFVEYMLMEMTLESKVLQEKRPLWQTIRFYTSRIVGLHLWLFNLQDNRGFLDTSVPGYQSKLFSSWQTVYEWSCELDSMSDLPYRKKRVFREYSQMALVTVSRLWAQVRDR